MRVTIALPGVGKDATPRHVWALLLVSRTLPLTQIRDPPSPARRRAPPSVSRVLICTRLQCWSSASARRCRSFIFISPRVYRSHAPMPTSSRRVYADPAAPNLCRRIQRIARPRARPQPQLHRCRFPLNAGLVACPRRWVAIDASSSRRPRPWPTRPGGCWHKLRASRGLYRTRRAPKLTIPLANTGSCLPSLSASPSAIVAPFCRHPASAWRRRAAIACCWSCGSAGAGARRGAAQGYAAISLPMWAPSPR